jgi:putative hemolysin
MVEYILLNSLVLIILLMLSASFSAIETAFYSVDRFKVKRFVKKRRAGSINLQNLKKKQTTFLVTVLLLNNVVNIAAASFTTTVVLQIFPENIAIAITTFGLTFIILVFGEITPKAIAVKHADQIMLSLSGAILFGMFILSPITFVLEMFTTKVVGVYKKESLTKDEVRLIVSLGVEEGAIDNKERELIHRVFNLGETTVEDIMTPRVEVIMVESDKKLSSLKSFLKKHPYSKIPVYEKDIDHIVGIFNVRTILNYFGKKLDVKIGSVVDKPLFVPSSKKIGDLLKEFQEKKVHIAIVVDEFGTFLGVVTLEDILEELVGEITEDKDDEYEMKVLNERTAIVEGGTELSTINEEFHLNLKSKTYNTVAGLIIESLDRFPVVGEKVNYENVVFEVLEVKGARIFKVKIVIK